MFLATSLKYGNLVIVSNDNDHGRILLCKKLFGCKLSYKSYCYNAIFDSLYFDVESIKHKSSI